MTDSIAAIILAAGSASRMGQPKQLLDWGGRALVRVVAEHALAARLDRVLVVVGAAGDEVAAALAGLPVEIVENQAYAEGQSTSLRAGVAALGPEVSAALVLLGDQPFVTPAIVERIADEWRMSGAAIVAPVYRGQRGNPVLFARAVFDQLLAIKGDQGARAILAADPARVRTVAFDDDRPLADIDTPEDYERLVRSP
jgi:molybdenum cofactor cytidylyltransferase